MRDIFLLKVLPLFVVLITSFSQAQSLKIQLGSSITAFRYTQANGVKANYLKPSSGLAFGLAFHKASLVDSAKYKLDQTPFAIYLGQNPKVVKLLSLINYDMGLQFTQLNAVGDIQNNAFSYQTDYIGLHGKLGLRIPLPWKFSLNLQGIASANKIVLGNQLLMNRYVDLTEDAQFAQVKIMGGYGVEFEKGFSDKLVGFFAYQQTQTLNSNPVDQSTLHFKPTIFSVGIRLLN